ncbi:MAG: DUF4038 domain-containing protein [Acidimicrobiia bacterium]|nr:DUF4038 domain-containing protein [Acidimicrobiia bacterium]RZV41690.1 MAG: DUF4038 domain-containing protein [Acidimicrobiales bacterium]
MMTTRLRAVAATALFVVAASACGVDEADASAGRTLVESSSTTSISTTPTTVGPMSATSMSSTSSSTTSTTTSSTTSTLPPVDATTWIADSAPTVIPVYDTAWQLFALATPEEANGYFAALADYGFSGAWAAVLHHEPATLADNFAGGGRMGEVNSDGYIALDEEYIQRVVDILDAAHANGMKVGVVPAWQNLYLPGGASDAGNAASDEVRGSINETNAWAFGRQIAEAIGSHPGVSMWVFGGDASSNNTEDNKAIWRLVANGIKSTGNEHRIAYHSPTAVHDQNNYAGEWWLDVAAPQTGHTQTSDAAQLQLEASRGAYGVPVWSGESRYFNIDFDWIPAAFRNPGVNEMRNDALAAEAAAVEGFVYGDAGRWRWCRPGGDLTPCSRDDIGASFGAAERAVVDVFRTP